MSNMRASIADDISTLNGIEQLSSELDLKIRHQFDSSFNGVNEAVKLIDLNEPLPLVDDPLFVPIGNDGLLKALEELDKRSVKNCGVGILSKKTPSKISWSAYEVPQGSIGLYREEGHPKVIARPGLYSKVSFLETLGYTWDFVRPLTQRLIQFSGLVMIQLYDNEVAVVSTPQNKTILAQAPGFVATSTEGAYNIISVVDKTNLPNTTTSGVPSGWAHAVFSYPLLPMADMTGSAIATFLNVPAYANVVMRHQSQFYNVGPGQYATLASGVSIHSGWATTECGYSVFFERMLTRDHVPLDLIAIARFICNDPAKVAMTGVFEVPSMLVMKLQGIIQDLVAQVNYKELIAGGDKQAPTAALSSLIKQSMARIQETAREAGGELLTLNISECIFQIDSKKKEERPQANDSAAD